MRLNLNIQNFGKLEDARIHIGGFTVFAGPNNTGKSYVSKLLYSLFNAMNADHGAARVNDLIQPVIHDLEYLLEASSGKSQQMQDIIQDIRDRTQRMMGVFFHTRSGNNGEFEIFRDLRPEFEKIKNSCGELEEIAQKEEFFKVSPLAVAATIQLLRQHINELYATINSKTDPKDFVLAGLASEIRRNLIRNFQAHNLSLLRSRKGDVIVIDIDVEGIGNFKFVDGETSSIEVTGLELLREMQKYSRVIYLESPVYWKLKPALDNVAKSRRFYKGRESLTGIPNYFYDLSFALGETYAGDVAFPDLLERLTGKDGLDGKIAISDIGELVFQERGHSFSLPLTAMGIANIGILALLIERKIIDKDAVVFIDEPEAHLHPAWQVVMAETLFELSRQGVNVVIATHSADILKWIEVHVKEKPEDKAFIALNGFTPQGVGDNEQDFEVKLASIKKSLTEPFSNLYLKSLSL